MKLKIKLTPAQLNISKSTKRFKIVRAGRRFGKSYFGIYWLLKQALSKPGSINWYVSQELRLSREVALPLMKSMLSGVGYSESKVDMTLTMENGSKIFFKSAETTDNLRGRSVDAIVLEECAFWLHFEEVWNNILRPQLADRKGEALFISSPNGSNYFRQLEDSIKDDVDWEIFIHTIYDNPFIDKNEIASIKKTTKEDIWKQEYLAEYVDTIGLVYWEISADNIQTLNEPSTKFNLRSMDWGIEDNTACVWINYLDDNSIYISDEYVVNNTDIPTISDSIKAKTKVYPRITLMDQSAFKRESDFHSVADRFKVQGINLVPATRNMDIGITAIKELLSSDKLIIHPRCVNIIESVKNWNYNQHEPDVLAALRYGISWLVQNKYVMITIKPHVKTIKEHIEEQNRLINKNRQLQMSFFNSRLDKQFFVMNTRR